MTKQKEDVIQIRITREIKEKYLEYCNLNGFSLSKRIRLFINTELGEKKQNN